MTKPLAFVIEDDLDLAEIFDAALQTGGFATQVISSGDAALTALDAAEPQVVVLDLHLPNVSGAEILHHIRANPRLTEVRVIIATADPRMAEMLEEQADLVLIKPISFSQLRDLAIRIASTV